jgi:hypothetical protein
MSESMGKVQEELVMVQEMQCTLKANKRRMSSSDPDFDWVLEEEERLRVWEEKLKLSLRELP